MRLSPARCVPARCFPSRCLPARAVRIILRVSIILTVLIVGSVFYLRHTCLLGGYPGIYGGSCYKSRNYVSAEVESYARAVPDPAPTVHVVVASTTTERLLGKTSWLSAERLADLLGLPRANVELRKYVADDGSAEFHPRFNKGHEVGMYLTYIAANYASLPDLVIFMHGEEYAWHVEPLLLGSNSYALSRLDLNQVVARGFVNLRVSWRDGCPDWINTTIPAKESTKKEEPLMRKAWAENFAPKGAAHTDPPEILAAPCCSQFAVTRDAILRNKKSQYERHLEWLQATSLNDDLSGRVWERLFQYLFSGRAVDCPVERKAYCSLYRICLSAEEWAEYSAAEDEDLRLRKSIRSAWAVVWQPWWGWGFTHRLAFLDDKMKRLRQKGLISGKHDDVLQSVGDIYAP